MENFVWTEMDYWITLLFSVQHAFGKTVCSFHYETDQFSYVILLLLSYFDHLVSPFGQPTKGNSSP